MDLKIAHNYGYWYQYNYQSQLKYDNNANDKIICYI